MVTQQVWSKCCNFVCFILPTTCRPGDELIDKLWIRWDIRQGYHICRSKIPDSLNGYFSRQQTTLCCIFSIFVQLPIHRKTSLLSLYMQNYCRRWKQPKKQKLTRLIFTAHAHCFKLKRNLLTGKLPDVRAFLKIISPSLKAFPFSAIASLNLKLNSVPSRVSFLREYHFLVPLHTVGSSQ